VNLQRNHSYTQPPALLLPQPASNLSDHEHKDSLDDNNLYDIDLKIQQAILNTEMTLKKFGRYYGILD
jgi:hypothetical protein